MDDTLIQTLNGSFSADQNLREQAEAVLLKSEQVEGYLTALVRIWVNQSVDVQVRQAAAIQAKNCVRRHWSRAINFDGTMVEGSIGTPGTYEVPDAEKTFVKENMIQILLHCAEQSNLRSQALEVVKLVVCREYPIRWPTFLSQCLTLVSSGEDMKVFCGLACIRVIAREFEMKSSGKAREPLEELITAVMPGLLALGEQLLAKGDQVLPATLLKFILKIFYSSVQVRLSKNLADHAICARWFELCSRLCRVVPADPAADIEEGVHAKLHKWAFRILHRFFARYGNPDLADAQDETELKEQGYDVAVFAKWWLATFAPPLVGLVSEVLKTPLKISKAAKYQALSFLSEAIQHGVTYKAMKPHLHSLLFEVIFPLMCFTAEDNELWESDPEEFVRREFDCMVAFSDPRSAAVEFLKNMVSLRSKDSLGAILRFCESHLFVESATGEGLKDVARCARKDGALAIIGSIAPQLCVACKKSKKKKSTAVAAANSAAERLPDKSQLESLLSQFVLPDFGSPVGFLRYRACWVYQQFAEEQFPFSNPQTTQAAFMGYRSCLADKALPVRVQAGCSVKSFILHEDFGPLIQPAVPELLDKLLKLMHEIDCEALSSTLESLVTEYADQVLPFAAQAVEQLARVFVRLSKADESDDEAQLACMGSIQTICTIMESACETPTLYVALEPVCYPILDTIFTPDGIDFMEEALDILTYLTFYCPEPLSPGLWKYFDLIHQSVCGGQLPGFPLEGSTVNGWAIDYAENMLNVVDNYVSRTPAMFIAGKGSCGKPFLQMLYEIVDKALNNDSEITQVAGAKIAACVFESCPRGSIDDWVKPFMQLAWSKFSAESSILNRWLFYLLVMMLWYDPIVAGKVANSLSVSNDYFTVFAKLAKFAKSKYERKALVLALCGMIKRVSDLSAISQIVSTLMKDYVNVLAIQSKEIAEMRKRQREAALEGSEEEESEEDEDEIDIQDLDESQSADQSAKINISNRLKEEIALIREQLGNSGFLDDDDEDDSDYVGDEDEDDCERISPLDGFNEFGAVKETLLGLNMEMLLSWFSQADLVAWNQLLEENIRLDQQDKLKEQSSK